MCTFEQVFTPSNCKSMFTMRRKCLFVSNYVKETAFLPLMFKEFKKFKVNKLVP